VGARTLALPNLLATRRGRLLAFFLLYVTEGIPSGFTGTAIATQMRRQGLEPGAIGAFVAALWIPWAIKWAFGPIVDVIASDRWGRRRGWILVTQLLMAATLLAAMPISFRTRLELFTAIILVHNVFAATQDVAIDALAVGTLRDDERGLANGLMFGGFYIGGAIGGSGVLLLTSFVGFQNTFVLVAAVIAAVTFLVPYPMREPPSVSRLTAEGSRIRAIGRGLAEFVRDTGKAFVGSRAAFLAIFLALLPMGGYALSLALQSNIAVDLGLTDRQVGTLGLMGTAFSSSCCVLGGWLSDRFGRRRTLALFIAATTLPTFALAFAMQRFGWILPVNPTAAVRPEAPAELVRLFWILALCYAAFQGFMYGVGTAIFMDVTTPAVAATQFTAYMALCNVVFAYSAWWQGRAAERWGYPATLVLDGAFGLVSLSLLPFMGGSKRPEATAAPSTSPA
jgi:PAT family beta-lactamase induction signal transducer AmpG